MGYYLVDFDYDGVLADSKPAHEQFARDQARRHGIEFLGFEFMVSPMEELLLKNGFPRDVMGEVIKEYKTTFHSNYEIGLFEGVPEMLEALRKKGVSLNIASANRLINIKNVLGNSICLFDDIWTIESGDNKVQAIRKVLKRARCYDSGKAVFIGDTMGDVIAAKETPISFIGAGYGWDGKTFKRKREEVGLCVVDSVKELSDLLLKD